MTIILYFYVLLLILLTFGIFICSSIFRDRTHFSKIKTFYRVQNRLLKSFSTLFI